MTDFFFKGWHFARWARMIVALVLLTAFFITGDNLSLLLALFVGIQATFNMGCCSPAVGRHANMKSEDINKEIAYEEIN